MLSIKESFFNPKNWKLKFYFWVSATLIILSLFGSRGLVHHVLLLQEEKRLTEKIRTLENQIQAHKKSLNTFSRYSEARYHAIREELGLLQEDEMSFEFGSYDDQKTDSAKPIVGPEKNP